MRKKAKYFQFTSRYHDIINNYTLFITILSTIQEVIYPFHCLDLNINSPLHCQQIRYNCSFENLVLNLSISYCSYSTNFCSSRKLFLCVLFMARKLQRWPQIKQQINPFDASPKLSNLHYRTPFSIPLLPSDKNLVTWTRQTCHWGSTVTYSKCSTMEQFVLQKPH